MRIGIFTDTYPPFINGVSTSIVMLKKALEKFRTQTIYLIIGLMLGSLYAIIMGPTTLKDSMDPMSIKTFSIIFFIIGGIIIFTLDKIKLILNKRK